MKKLILLAFAVTVFIACTKKSDDAATPNYTPDPALYGTWVCDSLKGAWMLGDVNKTVSAKSANIQDTIFLTSSTYRHGSAYVYSWGCFGGEFRWYYNGVYCQKALYSISGQALKFTQYYSSVGKTNLQYPYWYHKIK